MKKKRRIIIVIVLLFIAIIGGTTYAVSQWIFMSKEDKDKAISECIAKKDYTKAIGLTDKYYSGDSDYDTIISNINLCKQYNESNIAVAKQKRTQEEEQKAYKKFVWKYIYN